MSIESVTLGHAKNLVGIFGGLVLNCFADKKSSSSKLTRNVDYGAKWIKGIGSSKK